LQAPENHPAVPAGQAREQSGNEPGSDGAVLLVGSRSHDLVQRAERQPAARQDGIDGGEAERHGATAKPAGLEGLDASAQGAKIWVRRSSHGTSFTTYVRFLFPNNDSAR